MTKLQQKLSAAAAILVVLACLLLQLRTLLRLQQHDGPDRADGYPQRPLSFLHIPKTAGSSIERMAAEQGIRWGRCFYKECKYDVDTQHNNNNNNNNITLRLAPAINQTTAAHLKSLKLPCNTWYHVPLQLLPPNIPNPYQGTDVFVVIRHPYDRILSDFYMVCGQTRNCEKDPVQRQVKISQPAYMNQWIQRRLAPLVECPGMVTSSTTQQQQQQQHRPAYSSCYFQYCAHYIPQSHYVYDYFSQPPNSSSNNNNNNSFSRGRQKLVQHVLSFERLSQDLQALLPLYGWGHDDDHHHSQGTTAMMMLTTQREMKFDGRFRRLNRTHLTAKTRKLIHRIYRDDFELFKEEEEEESN